MDVSRTPSVAFRQRVSCVAPNLITTPVVVTFIDAAVTTTVLQQW
jgi:hypothetical protein